MNTCNCVMSMSNPLVTLIHNRTICVNMVNVFAERVRCVLKDIVNVKQLLDKNLTSFNR